jgi:hypothetical protein
MMHGWKLPLRRGRLYRRGIWICGNPAVLPYMSAWLLLKQLLWVLVHR